MDLVEERHQVVVVEWQLEGRQQHRAVVAVAGLLLEYLVELLGRHQVAAEVVEEPYQVVAVEASFQAVVVVAVASFLVAVVEEFHMHRLAAGVAEEPFLVELLEVAVVDLLEQNLVVLAQELAGTLELGPFEQVQAIPVPCAFL